MGRRASSKFFTLDNATEQGHLVRVKCGCCMRTAHYLPEDLAKIFGGFKPALKPLFNCSRCKTTDYMRVETFSPGIGDFGKVTIRRPGAVKTIQTWRREVFTERTRVPYTQTGDYGF